MSALPTKHDEIQGSNMKATQTAQNKMIRMVDNVSLKDHIRSADLLNKYGLLSVNQLASQIKLVEAWKAVNLEDYPIQPENNQLQRNANGRAVRKSTVKLWKDDTKCATAKESFLRDAAELWNNAPLSVKNTKSLYSAKNEIVKFCKSIAF